MSEASTKPEAGEPAAVATRPVRFFHRGQIAEVDPASSTRTVLEWLREDARCTGTKEGCAEGDCGACMVVLGELDGQGALQWRPVNSCIQFLPTLDGKALFTVEDLAGADGALHPAQAAMVDCHGSQCGFCTPGFVMSLWASYQRHQPAATAASRQQLADDLSGNLCRCTGYRPILDAGQQMFERPAVAFDGAPVADALRRLAADSAQTLHTRSGFHAPRTLAELAALRQQLPQATLLAGSTDIGIWVTKQFRPLGEIIWLGRVDELKRVEFSERQLHIGAGASLEAAWQALVQEWPSLRDLWLRFASMPLRRAGTLGGNVANGSPIGDAAPVLMALDASVVLQQGEHQRRMPLHHFYTGYMKNQLRPGEFLAALELPRRRAGQQLQAYKISKRFDCDISAVSAGLAIELHEPDADRAGRVRQVRLAFGGLAGTVARAAKAEAALLGQPWTAQTLQAAQAALAEDFTPLSDMRASAAYRLQVAQNLLRRFWLQTRPASEGPPLEEREITVWARDAAKGDKVNA